MSQRKWFRKGKHTGWRKKHRPTTRRSNLLSTTDKRRTMHNRYIQAGRRANQLANVTVDVQTKKRARADADYFFKKARKTSRF